MEGNLYFLSSGSQEINFSFFFWLCFAFVFMSVSDIRELITKPGVNQATGTTFDLRFVPSKDVTPMEDAKPSAEDATVEGEPPKNPDGTMEVEDDVDYVEHDIDIMRHPGTVHVIEENQY